MNQMSTDRKRQKDFLRYLRTGRQPPEGQFTGRQRMELKFNPNHDPRNGQFAFGPGGAQSSNQGRTGGQVSERRSTDTSPASSAVQRHVKRALAIYHAEVARGKSPEEAAAWAANAEAESGSNPRSVQQGGGPGRGLFQWGSNDAADRRVIFQKVMGIPIEQSTTEQQLLFRDWELAHTHQAAKRAIDAASGAADKSRAITNYYEVPNRKIRQAQANARAALAEHILRAAAPHRKH